MEIIQRTGQLKVFEIAKVKKGPNSERAEIISRIEALTGCPRKALLFKHLKHIPGGEKGIKLLKYLYEEAMTADTPEGKRKRFYWMLKQTKV